ncbi:hypothetical protein EMIHUDRAFT_233321 [Emiliania huxleyi CCMP1516]|uniref:Rieske domain-containing protein n=2 Tax=Emiliania huxleyi TaxID=2903 RepID=A0A0D3K2E8_EMIH1|nr:hypothetical protein EMIHUDRAFT_233321 [Emiliania huxleyi CCMP1516]EOD29933.1 hypothetical protein EMIHUDRAFT_233321 [Emiliania huxleyi CCMP1516]|eukprot:XP_005782362.1 hypothetical protein EMIHUDRAFT_233321 [Emiliania huxleyi CCMP1516]
MALSVDAFDHLVNELQSELFSDDLQPPRAARGTWTHARLLAFFESGGVDGCDEDSSEVGSEGIGEDGGEGIGEDGSSPPPGFVPLPGVSEPADGAAVAAALDDGRRVAVFSSGGDLYAVDADCPHMGVGLEEGDIEDLGSGPCVVCPWHGWSFELRSGYCELMDSYMLRAYDVLALPDGSLCVSSASRPPPEPPSGRDEID